MIEFVKCLRGAGMPVELLIQYFALVKQGEETTRQRRQMLVNQREVLLNRQQELKETLKRLENKILFYDQKLQEEEKEKNGAETC